MLLCTPLHTNISPSRTGVKRPSRPTLRVSSHLHSNPLTRTPKHTPTAPSFGAAPFALAALVSLGLGDAARAERLSVTIENASYSQVDCKGNGKIAGQGSIKCIEFSGTVQNKNKKAINTADVYGRIFDAVKNDVTDNEENDRIAYVDLIPPGVSTVTFTIAVPESQLKLGPLSWKGLKASGFTGKVLPGQAGLLGLPDEIDCSSIGENSDIFDIEQCEEQAVELLIR